MLPQAGELLNAWWAAITKPRSTQPTAVDATPRPHNPVQRVTPQRTLARSLRRIGQLDEAPDSGSVDLAAACRDIVLLCGLSAGGQL
jgi:hypothetical protein